MFRDTLRVRVDPETKMVSLSLRASDSKVEVHSITLADFQKAVNEFQAQLKDFDRANSD